MYSYDPDTLDPASTQPTSYSSDSQDNDKTKLHGNGLRDEPVLFVSTTSATASPCCIELVPYPENLRRGALFLRFLVLEQWLWLIPGLFNFQNGTTFERYVDRSCQNQIPGKQPLRPESIETRTDYRLEVRPFFWTTSTCLKTTRSKLL